MMIILRVRRINLLAASLFYEGKNLSKRFSAAASNKLRAPIQAVLQNPRGIKYVYSDTPIENTCRRTCAVAEPDQVGGKERPDRYLVGGLRTFG